jgi:hypothetical protein
MQAKLLLLAVLFFVASSAAAQVPAGSGTLSGPERLKVTGCPKGVATPSVGVTLAADGAFTIGTAYSGTSTTLGRVTRLTLDAPSLALFDTTLEVNASNVCGIPVTVNSVVITQAMLKISKRGNRAKLQIKASGAGTSAEGSGNGKYRLKATGAWAPATAS